MHFVQNVNGIRKIEAQMVTKMDNSIKKGKLVVRKLDKCRASMHGTAGYQNGLVEFWKH